MAQDEKKIITGDASWCFPYNPETKGQSTDWVGKNSPKLKNLCFQKSHVKKMLTNFLIQMVLSTDNSIQRAKPLLQHITEILWNGS
jgi:hypothetical protein